MLPLVHRELLSAVRHPKFYRRRIGVAFLEIVVAAFLAATQRTNGKGGAFWFFAILALLLCLFEGLRKTADSISEEKREGTLGLLFLTDLNGFNIIAGKLSAGLIRSGSLLLAFVPILAFTLLLGGVTFGEFWRVVLVLFNTLWASLSICLLISCLGREKNLLAGFFTLFLLAIVPWIAGGALDNFYQVRYASQITALSPFVLIRFAADSGYSLNETVYWIGVVVLHGLGWLSLLLAAVIVPRTWQEKAARKSKLSKERVGGAKASPERNAERAQMLDKNPIYWLAYSRKFHRYFVYTFYPTLFITLAAVVWFRMNSSGNAIIFGSSFALFILSSIIFSALASQASRTIAEAKRTGAMELLLSTPLKVDEIISGHWLAIRKIFLAPAIITGLWFAGMIFMAPGSRGVIIGPVNFFVQFVLGIFVIGWVGLWMGLSSKTPQRALFRTILFGIIVPSIFCLPTFLNQVVLLVLAMDKARYNFRRFIAERYLQNKGFILALPQMQKPGEPPVIRPPTELPKTQ
jgi:ABC-type Na+ efflux pump permease subunit